LFLGYRPEQPEHDPTIAVDDRRGRYRRAEPELVHVAGVAPYPDREVDVGVGEQRRDPRLRRIRVGRGSHELHPDFRILAMETA
jgi:hypothetical protein